jgi:hypothetical protein
MDNCILKPVWSTLKPVILAKFLTGANRQHYLIPVLPKSHSAYVAQ